MSLGRRTWQAPNRALLGRWHESGLFGHRIHHGCRRSARPLIACCPRRVSRPRRGERWTPTYSSPPSACNGQSNSRKLHAGWRFKLKNYPDRAVNREYLVVHSVTTITSAEGTPNPKADSVDTYRVTVRSIPGDASFRLDRYTPTPIIRGPEGINRSGIGTRIHVYPAMPRLWRLGTQ